MTDDELRLAIAKAKGWSDTKVLGDCFVVYSPEGYVKPNYPDWPTDIGAAWELVEEMRAGGVTVEITADPNDDNNQERKYGIVLRREVYTLGWAGFMGWATTAARAICEAWLVWHNQKGAA